MCTCRQSATSQLNQVGPLSDLCQSTEHTAFRAACSQSKVLFKFKPLRSSVLLVPGHSILLPVWTLISVYARQLIVYGALMEVSIGYQVVAVN